MLIKNANSTTQNIGRLTLATLAILLIPLVAMQFSEEVDWDVADFVIMGALIFSTGLAYELATRKVNDRKRRMITGAVLLGIFFLIWAELAVGLFGTPFAGS